MSEPEDYLIDSKIEEDEEKMLQQFYEEGRVDEIIWSNEISNVVDLYNIDVPDNRAMYQSTFEDDLKLCKNLLSPIQSDIMPINRQVYVFANLVNFKFTPLENQHFNSYKGEKLYHSQFMSILECAIYKPKDLVLAINPMIPKKHYEEKLKDIYAQSNINSLQIPIDNATEYLQELFDIWIEHTVYEKNSYQIYKKFTTYASKGTSYDKTQITRKLNSIKNLIK